MAGDLARQAGIAVHAVRLTHDLQRSRERLITAREEERRRLRRDLHDGLEPQLASLRLTLAAALELLRHDVDAAERLLQELAIHTQAAIADIRRVVYDLRPPARDDLGLVLALREQAAHYRQAGLQITIDAPEQLPPLPAAVEVVADRIVQEALTNVVRHAQARTCAVRLTLSDALDVEIRDDGVGLPPDRRAGVGLTSMRERTAELGGTYQIESMLGRGTCIHARLPLRESAAYRADYSLDAFKREIGRRKSGGATLLPTTARLWARLKDLFQIIDVGSPPLHVATFNGGLFDPARHPFLEQYTVGDARLLEAIDKLARVGEEFIDYRDLAERHLGTIYEGLLEYHLEPIRTEGRGLRTESAAKLLSPQHSVLSPG